MADITLTTETGPKEYEWSNETLTKFKYRFGSAEQKNYLISLAVEKCEKEVLSLGVQVAVKEKLLDCLTPEVNAPQVSE